MWWNMINSINESTLTTTAIFLLIFNFHIILFLFRNEARNDNKFAYVYSQQIQVVLRMYVESSEK